ncbi:MAG: hypothetical protein WC740_09400 [Verrucomicrobiia bacterium]
MLTLWLWFSHFLPGWAVLVITAAIFVAAFALFPYITRFDLKDDAGDLGTPNRKRRFWIAGVFALIVSAVVVVPITLLLLSSDLIVLASVQESRIGTPPDRIDSYVPDGHSDQYFFVRFKPLRILKGTYTSESLGVRLHSPALTFGIRNDKSKGLRYLLFFRYVVASDAEKVLVLTGHLKTSS